MTDWKDLSEEAFKNGFEKGYVQGLGDKASELLDGAIRWHKRFQKEDVNHCFVVCRDDDRVTRVYLRRYCAKMNVFAMDGWLYISEGSPQYIMWGEYRPVEFTSPGMDG
jgi:hypothetical protein